MYSGNSPGSEGRRSTYEKQDFNAKGRTKLRTDYKVSDYKSGEYRTSEYGGTSDFRVSDAREGSQEYGTSDFRSGGQRARGEGQSYDTGTFKTGESRANGQNYSTYDNAKVSKNRYIESEPVDNIVELQGREESFTFKDIKKMVGQ